MSPNLSRDPMKGNYGYDLAYTGLVPGPNGLYGDKQNDRALLECMSSFSTYLYGGTCAKSFHTANRFSGLRIEDLQGG